MYEDWWPDDAENSGGSTILCVSQGSWTVADDDWTRAECAVLDGDGRYEWLIRAVDAAGVSTYNNK
jgi:hypothetical protein